MALWSKQLGIAALVVSLTLVACGSEGTANDERQVLVDDVPPQLFEATGTLSSCQGEYIRENIHREVTVEELVAAALDRCADQEQEVYRVVSELDGDWRDFTSQLREKMRVSLTALVESARSGQSPSSPNQAWGVCVRRSLPAKLGADEFDQAFDDAIAACAEEGQKVRDWLAETGGQEAVEANWRSYVELLRQRAREVAITS